VAIIINGDFGDTEEQIVLASSDVLSSHSTTNMLDEINRETTEQTNRRK
jgi:hypothetical protein